MVSANPVRMRRYPPTWGSKGPFLEFLGGVKGGIGRFTRQTSGAQAVLDEDNMGGFADNVG